MASSCNCYKTKSLFDGSHVKFICETAWFIESLDKLCELLARRGKGTKQTHGRSKGKHKLYGTVSFLVSEMWHILVGLQGYEAICRSYDAFRTFGMVYRLGRNDVVKPVLTDLFRLILNFALWAHEMEQRHDPSEASSLDAQVHVGHDVQLDSGFRHDADNNLIASPAG